MKTAAALALMQPTTRLRRSSADSARAMVELTGMKTAAALALRQLTDCLHGAG